MQLLRKLLSLPAALLLLLSSIPPAQAAEDDRSQAQWPHNRPPHAKYWPEDPPHRRRDLEAIQEHILAGHAPVAMKKMSRDESEKFFPEYWGFEEHENQFALSNDGLRSDSTAKSLREGYSWEDAKLPGNRSALLSFRPAFAVHAEQKTSLSRKNSGRILDGVERIGRTAASALTLLESRAFQCPAGTLPCATIDPNLCCAMEETCFSIPDTGLGTVGCCPNGASCVGNITCAAGNTPCASSIGGGCCIPGFVCANIGCVPEIVTIISSIIVSTTIIPPTTSSPITTTSSSTITDTAIQTTQSCGCSYQACGLNLGGGCCPIDRLCGLGGLCPLPSGTNTILVKSSGSCSFTTTATISAPIRPTSASDNATPAPTTTPTPTVTGGSCPTGFYACSAYYQGGCCRTGRDCATTDCPSTASKTIVSSGVTIVVPLVGDATTTASGSCQTGWYNCLADQGGSCCPSGWSCGLESCTSIGASSTAVDPKQGEVLNGSGRPGPCSFWALGMIGLILAPLIAW